MVRDDDAPVIGKAGVVAAAGAAGVVLAAFMRLTSGTPGWPTIMAVFLASAGTIVVLCRTTMPAQLRGPLVLALVATMFFGVARADLFGTHKVGAEMALGADIATQGSAAIDSYATGVAANPARAVGGAEIALVAGRAGGGADWARDINAAWRGRIGGHLAQDIRIDGWVDEEGHGDGLTRIAVDWGITQHFAEQRCGLTTSAGRDRATLIQAVAEPMAQAVERTLREGKASCP